MRLKQVIMQGFKSFADRVVVKFEGGIIGVVGPNGCGKSNIADAIRWVTGEKSAKSIRSPSMTDVIFSGTATRKPLNFAEVTLVLTDVQGVLPTDFEEVAITRKLYRSGESQYFVNKQLVRRKDIEDLLAGSGIGHSGISIFAQGEVDRVIYLNPTERRSILEEVAGISRFVVRKKETMRNLLKTEDNLARVQDILHEVEKQKNTAERQAEKAIIYQECTEKLEGLEKSVLVCKWQKLTEESKELRVKEEEVSKELTECTLEVKEKETKLHELRVHLDEREQVLRKKSASLYEVKSKKEVQEQTKKLHDEQLEEAAKRETELKQELAILKEKQRQGEEEKEQFKREVEESEKLALAHEKELLEEQEKTKRLEEEVVALREAQARSQRERVQNVQEEGRLEGEWKEIKLKIDHHLERLGHAKIRLGQLTEDLSAYQEASKEKQLQLNALSKQVDGEKQELLTIEKEYEATVSENKQTKNDLEVVKKSLSEKSARIHVLQRLKEEMQGLSTCTKQLLEEGKNKESHLFEKISLLSEQFTLDETLQENSAVALRQYSQTLVVKNHQDFLSVLAFARSHHMKGFSLLCLEHLIQEKEILPVEGGKPLLSSDFPCLFSKRFLRHIHVVKDPETATFLGMRDGIEFCTEDHAFVDRHRVVFYPGREENNTFQREAEIKTLEKSILKKKKEKEELEQRIASREKKREELYQKKGEKDKALRVEEMKLVEVNFALQRIRGDLEKGMKEQDNLKQQTVESQARIDELKQKMDEVASLHKKAKQKVEEMNLQNNETETLLVTREEVFKTQQQTQREKEQAFKEVADKLKEISYRLSHLQSRLEEGREREEKVITGIQATEEIKLRLSEEDVSGEKELDEVEEILQRYAKAVQEEEASIEEQKKTTQELENLVSKKRLEEKELIDRKNKIEVKLSHHESISETLVHDLDERYQLTMGEVEVQPLEDFASAEKEVKDLRKKIERLGPVNMEAIHEKEEHAKRYEHLSVQVQDLTIAKDELIQIIEELERESRILFEETFLLVQENFKKNFSILFNGGEADLQLVGSEDVLEAGIEVTAKPPGKKMRSITLLSGGEKCMTALAFLFAIFEVKPAPFCVLDEIDAPLDDSNIGRFVEVLKQFTKLCQFIVITHNKRTMSITDALYGISMQEKGVSKILSLAFSKEEQIAEPQLVN